MIPTIINLSLHCQFEDSQFVGINGSYVDDLLRAETNERKTHSDDILERFETPENEQAHSHSLECISLNLKTCTISIKTSIRER